MKCTNKLGYLDLERDTRIGKRLGYMDIMNARCTVPGQDTQATTSLFAFSFHKQVSAPRRRGRGYLNY